MSLIQWWIETLVSVFYVSVFEVSTLRPNVKRIKYNVFLLVLVLKSHLSTTNGNAFEYTLVVSVNKSYFYIIYK